MKFRYMAVQWLMHETGKSDKSIQELAGTTVKKVLVWLQIIFNRLLETAMTLGSITPREDKA